MICVLQTAFSFMLWSYYLLWLILFQPPIWYSVYILFVIQNGKMSTVFVAFQHNCLSSRKNHITTFIASQSNVHLGYMYEAASLWGILALHYILHMLFYIEIVVILRFWLIVKYVVPTCTRILDNKLVFKGTLRTNPLIIWSLYNLHE